MGEKKAGRARGRSRQGKTPGRGQSDVLEHAKHQRWACRSEPLFQRPKRFCRRRSLGDQEAIRIEPKGAKAGAIKGGELVGQGGRPTAKDGSLPPPYHTHGIAAADGKSQRKGPRRRPPRGKAMALFWNGRLHLVHRVDCQTLWAEKGIKR
jgi:hypothetical protein